jgi:nitrogen regulatory protein P-II 1
MLKIEVVTRDANADKAAETIAGAACTGEVGNGRIFVLPTKEAIRIRTGERGDTTAWWPAVTGEIVVRSGNRG